MRNNVKLTLAGISWNEYPCYKTEIRSKMEREKDGCFPSFFERITRDGLNQKLLMLKWAKYAIEYVISIAAQY